MKLEEKYDKIEKEIDAHSKDIAEYLRNEYDENNDHPDFDKEDHECYLTLFVRFNRENLELSDYNYNASDMETEPFSNSRIVMLGLNLCVNELKEITEEYINIELKRDLDDLDEIDLGEWL